MLWVIWSHHYLLCENSLWLLITVFDCRLLGDYLHTCVTQYAFLDLSICDEGFQGESCPIKALYIRYYYVSLLWWNDLRFCWYIYTQLLPLTKQNSFIQNFIMWIVPGFSPGYAQLLYNTGHASRSTYSIIIFSCYGLSFFVMLTDSGVVYAYICVYACVIT